MAVKIKIKKDGSFLLNCTGKSYPTPQRVRKVKPAAESKRLRQMIAKQIIGVPNPNNKPPRLPDRHGIRH
jgi:hypothetical protein